MEIFINEQKAQITLENEKNLGDILVGIESECEKASATVIGIELNGNAIEADKIEEFSKTELSNIETLKLTTVCKSDIYTSFKQIAQNIAEIEDAFSMVSANLQTGKDKEVNEVLAKFADIFDYFCRVITLSTLFPQDFSNFLIAGSSIKDFLADFSPILSDFENALQQKDTVSISDLAEYEILPRLQNIKDFCNEIQEVE